MSTVTAAPKEQNYFPALTGIRALAAYMVFLHHFNPAGKTFLNGSLHSFFNEFHIGVTVFFVLSGFLIAYRYIDAGKHSFKKYMVNRVARIYPMYFILTTLTFIFLYYTQQQNPKYSLMLYLSNITFIKGFFNDFVFTGISQGWSLTVEEIFYFSAPLFFILINKNIRNLLLLPVTIIAVGLLLVLVFSQQDFYGFFESNTFMFNYTFFGRCCEFFIGIGLAILFRQSHYFKNVKFKTYLGLSVIITCIISLSLLKGDYKYGVLHPIGILINNGLLPLLGIAVLFYGLLTEKTFLSRLLSTRLMILAGKSSYVFYLIHLGFIQQLLTNNISENYLVLFLLLNIISMLLFKTLEEPINNAIRKRFNRIN